MTSSFPSTSEVIIDIPERLYNLAELGKVIDGLKGAQGKLDSTADGSASEFIALQSALLHLDVNCSAFGEVVRPLIWY